MPAKRSHGQAGRGGAHGGHRHAGRRWRGATAAWINHGRSTATGVEEFRRGADHRAAAPSWRLRPIALKYR